MNYVKPYDEFLVEENLVRNLLLSSLLSLGLNYADAQTIKSDTLRSEVVGDIINYNNMLLNKTKNVDEHYKVLMDDLSRKLVNPSEFIDKYTDKTPDGCLTLRPNFLKGLGLNLRPRFTEISFTKRF